jgi:hypothetical protein
MGSDQYNAWRKKPGMSFLHLKGPSNMKLALDKLYALISIKANISNLIFFAFSKYYTRFNTLEPLLTSLLSQLISRFQQVTSISDA